MVSDTTRRRFVKSIGATAALTGLVGSATARPKPSVARYATYNVVDLGTEQVQEPGDEQAAAAARVIQEVRPDVLVVTNSRTTYRRRPSTIRSRRR